MESFKRSWIPKTVGHHCTYVEVGLAELDTRVGFGAGDVDGALMYAVVLEAGLEEDSLGLYGGEVEGCEEGLEDAGCDALSMTRDDWSNGMLSREKGQLNEVVYELERFYASRERLETECDLLRDVCRFLARGQNQ